MGVDKRLFGRWWSYDQRKTMQLEGDGTFYFGDSALGVNRTGTWSASGRSIMFGATQCGLEYVDDDGANNRWLNVSSSEGSMFADRWWRKIR